TSIAAGAMVSGKFLQLALFFLKVGATLFGGGYVLVSYLRGGLVDEKHWLSSQQLTDAVAVGQFTPGPLLTTATFIGYILGQQWAGPKRGDRRSRSGDSCHFPAVILLRGRAGA